MSNNLDLFPSGSLCWWYTKDEYGITKAIPAIYLGWSSSDHFGVSWHDILAYDQIVIVIEYQLEPISNEEETKANVDQDRKPDAS